MGIYDKERAKLGLNGGATSTSQYDEERQRLANPIINGATTLGVGGSRPPTNSLKTAPRLTPLNFRNSTGQTSIPADQQEKNTQTLLTELNGKQGKLATDVMGVATGFATGGFNQLLKNDAMDKRVYAQDTQNTFEAPYIKNPRAAMSGFAPLEVKQANIRRSDVGNFAGSMLAADPVGILATKGIEFAIGKIAARSGVATHVIEAALKNGDKGVTEAVQKEMTEIERLAQESNIRKGKITPQGDTLYGNSFKTAAGELPAPKTETPNIPQEDPFAKWRKENFGGAYGNVSQQDKNALLELYQETTQPNYMGAVGQREVPRTLTKNELPRVNQTQTVKNIPTLDEFKKYAKEINYDTDGGRVKWDYKGTKIEAPFNFRTGEQTAETAYEIFIKDMERKQGIKPLPQSTNLPPQPLKPNLGIKTPQEQVFAKTADLKTVRQGEEVIGIERGNKGTIAKQNEDGSYLVHFLNKGTGNEALIKMQRNEFEPIRNTIDDLNRSKLKPDPEPKAAPTLLDEVTQAHKTASDLEYLKSLGTQVDENVLKEAKGKIRKFNKERRENLQTYTDDLAKSADNWKDKSALAHIRETRDRNIIDIAGKDGKAIKEQVFDKVKASTAEMTRFINKSNETIGALKLSRKESSFVQQLGEGKITIHDIPDNLDAMKISNAVNVFKTWYSDTLDLANEVLIRNGYNPIPKRENYFPHFQGDDPVMKALGIHLDTSDLPTDLNGLSANFRPGKNWFGNALSRTGDKTTFDAVQGYDRYVQGISKIIYHTDNIQTLRSLDRSIRTRYSSPEISKRVKELLASELPQEEMSDAIDKVLGQGTHLSNLVADLTEYTNMLAGKKDLIDRSVESLLGRGVYNVSAFLENQLGKNMVALNPGSWLTNFIPLTQSLATNNKKAFLDAMVDTIKNTKISDGLVDKSTFLTSRYGSDVLDKGIVRKTSDVLTAPFFWIDHFTANVAVRAKYIEKLRAGSTPEEALRYADDWAGKLMTDRSLGAQARINDIRNPLIKPFTQFQAEVNNQLSFIFKDVPRSYKESAEGKKWIAQTASAMTQIAIYGFLYNQAYEAVVGRRPAPDPIYTGYSLGKGIKDKDTEAILKATGYGIQQLPFTGTFGGGRLPIDAAVPDLLKIGTVGTQVFTGKKTGTDLAKTVGKELVKPAAYLLPPFGGGQAKKTIEGALALKEGSQSNGKLRFPVEKTPGNIGKTLLFGQYSSNEGKDYIKNNRSMLSEKQTIAFKELTQNGGQKEIFDFITANKTDKTTGKPHTKASIIAAMQKSNLTDTQKRLLLTQFYGYKL